MKLVIAGPDVHICNECVELCVDILRDRGLEIIRPVDPAAEESTTVVRRLTLPPEFFHRGIALIGHFPVLLRRAHPRTSVRARMELDGYTVRLVIELPEEDKPLVQALLDGYGRALQRRGDTGGLPDDPTLAAELDHLIELTAADLATADAGSAGTGAHVILPVEERARRLHDALGWVFRREIEDIQELFWD